MGIRNVAIRQPATTAGPKDLAEFQAAIGEALGALAGPGCSFWRVTDVSLGTQPDAMVVDVRFEAVAAHQRAAPTVDVAYLQHLVDLSKSGEEIGAGPAPVTPDGASLALLGALADRPDLARSLLRNLRALYPDER